MEKKKLAIIIPAYKADFLPKTLESIAAQSMQEFTLYIGDDASPYPLAEIIRPFQDKITLVYHRFEENVGGKDLVGQWERCIDLAQEEWIWLFSDDDVMPEDAVARFYQAIEEHPGKEFFRFPLCRIDGKGEVEYQCKKLPEGVYGAEDMLQDYLAGKRPSAACEYIFSKRLYQQQKMVHFPLAWCSDTATWYNYAKHAQGIVSIDGKEIGWRNVEGNNISNTHGLQAQKMTALIGFVQWLQGQYAGKKTCRFAKALKGFIETNLNISFEGIYTQEDLRTLSQEYAKFSRFLAWKLYRKYSRKI